jgi:hypothetical protein
MLNRFRFAAALAVCLACGGCRGVMNCGEDCGRGCSMAFQKYDCSCDGVCGECCVDASGCDSQCGSACGNGCAECEPPVRRCLNRLFGCNGCGECYWNEWHNHPPSLCEPCDRCGNYVGPSQRGPYQAPYRRHDGFGAAPAELPPLEVADPAELPVDDSTLVGDETIE